MFHWLFFSESCDSNAFQRGIDSCVSKLFPGAYQNSSKVRESFAGRVFVGG